MRRWKNGLYRVEEVVSYGKPFLFKVYHGSIHISDIKAMSEKQRDEVASMLDEEVATVDFEERGIEVEMTDEGLEQAMLDIMEIYLNSHASDDIILQMRDSIIDDYEDNGEMDRYEFERWVNLVLRDSRVNKKKYMIERASKGLWF